MSDDIELRRLAEAATPGPWLGEDDEVWRPSFISELNIATTERNRDAAFIAAANPTAVLALLDERDALRAQVERVRALADEWETLRRRSPDAADAELRACIMDLRAALATEEPTT